MSGKQITDIIIGIIGAVIAVSLAVTAYVGYVYKLGPFSRLAEAQHDSEIATPYGTLEEETHVDLPSDGASPEYARVQRLNTPPSETPPHASSDNAAVVNEITNDEIPVSIYQNMDEASIDSPVTAGENIHTPTENGNANIEDELPLSNDLINMSDEPSESIYQNIDEAAVSSSLPSEKNVQPPSESDTSTTVEEPASTSNLISMDDDPPSVQHVPEPAELLTESLQMTSDPTELQEESVYENFGDI